MKRKGFTLLELMIVVAILGLLSVISIPKFAELLERSREGATKGNISALRSAISIYYSQNEGVWPVDLTTSFSNFIAAIPPAKATPLGNSTNVALVSAAPVSEGTGWAYLQSGGLIWVNSTATDTKGTSFTTY